MTGACNDSVRLAISVLLPRTLANEVKEVARRAAVPRGAVVALALDSYLRCYHGAQESGSGSTFPGDGRDDEEKAQ